MNDLYKDKSRVRKVNKEAVEEYGKRKEMKLVFNTNSSSHKFYSRFKEF